MAGKRIENAYKTIDKSKLYSLKDAVKLVKENANAKFDETVDLAINLGVDPKYADQMVRGVCSLPNGTWQNRTRRRFGSGRKRPMRPKAAGARYRRCQKT